MSGQTLILINEMLIFVFTALGVYLAGRTDEWMKWGFVSGMMAQPFWFIHAFLPDVKIGILFLTIVMTFMWFNGFRNHFLRRTT